MAQTKHWYEIQTQMPMYIAEIIAVDSQHIDDLCVIYVQSIFKTSRTHAHNWLIWFNLDVRFNDCAIDIKTAACTM